VGKRAGERGEIWNLVVQTRKGDMGNYGREKKKPQQVLERKKRATEKRAEWGELGYAARGGGR